MSGIVGGINLRSSGLVNLGSASDGTVFTGTGAGLPVGFEAAAGGGKVLQVIQAAHTAVVITTAADFDTLTGMAVTITPASGTRILLAGQIVVAGATASGAHMRLKRDSTVISLGDAASPRRQGYASTRLEHNNQASNIPISFVDEDHGADGSTAVVYSMEGFTDGGATFYVNRTTDDSSDAGRTRHASCIIAIEIGS